MKIVAFMASLLLTLFLVESAHAISGLRVKCNQEGAEIFLNDKSYGACPKNITAPAGNYKVVLKENLDDKSYWYYETQMNLADNTVEKIEAKLERVYPEVYYYEKTKGSSSIADYEEYLMKAPNGLHAEEIRQRLNSIEDNMYVRAKDGKSISDCEEYIRKYPNGKYIPEIKELLEESYYANTIQMKTIESNKKYLKRYPSGKRVKEIKASLEEVYYSQCTPEAYTVCEGYLDEYPTGKYIREARERIEDFYYKKAKNSKKIVDQKTYIDKYPNGIFVQEITQIMRYSDCMSSLEEKKKQVQNKSFTVIHYGSHCFTCFRYPSGTITFTPEGVRYDEPDDSSTGGKQKHNFFVKYDEIKLEDATNFFTIKCLFNVITPSHIWDYNKGFCYDGGRGDTPSSTLISEFESYKQLFSSDACTGGK